MIFGGVTIFVAEDLFVEGTDDIILVVLLMVSKLTIWPHNGGELLLLLLLLLKIMLPLLPALDVLIFCVLHITPIFWFVVLDIVLLLKAAALVEHPDQTCNEEERKHNYK